MLFIFIVLDKTVVDDVFILKFSKQLNLIISDYVIAELKLPSIC